MLVIFAILMWLITQETTMGIYKGFMLCALVRTNYCLLVTRC